MEELALSLLLATPSPRVQLLQREVSQLPSFPQVLVPGMREPSFNSGQHGTYQTQRSLGWQVLVLCREAEPLQREPRGAWAPWAMGAGSQGLFLKPVLFCHLGRKLLSASPSGEPEAEATYHAAS